MLREPTAAAPGRRLDRWRPRLLGPEPGGARRRFVYLAPNDVLVPRVDRQCIMRFCGALAERGAAVELLSLDVELEFAEPTAGRDLWDVYGLTTPFRVAILPARSRQRGRGGASLALWRAAVYGAYGLRRVWGLPSQERRRTVVYAKNALCVLPFVLARQATRRAPLVLYELHVPPHHPLARWLLRRVDGVVPVSRILARELQREHGIPAERLLVAHQGVDLEAVERGRRAKEDARRLLGLPGEARLVVYTGKVGGSQGEIDLLVEAAGRLGDGAQLVVVGGREDDVQALRARLRNDGVDNVLATGFVAPGDVFAYQHAADVLVSYYPSRIPLNRYRASPGKLFEYMAARRPIVTADIPALREVLGPQSAVFVAPDRPDLLAEAIERVLADDGLAARLAASAYADVQSFTWRRRAERVCAFVDRLDDGADAPPGVDPIEEAVSRMRGWGEARDWRGHDPYDALESPFARVLTLGTRAGRRALTQAVKLSPLDLRPALRIEAAWNAKGVALAASGYARLAAAGDVGAARQARRWLGWLVELATAEAGLGWGYHFDVQTRFFAYRRGTPNVIATSFAAHALLDGHEVLGERWLGEAAEQACAFLLERLLDDRHGTSYFRYLEREPELVHNANALACSVLARTAEQRDRADLAGRARHALDATLAAQRPDGSWPYAEGPGHGWVDNFHTGYVLESLACSASTAPAAVPALERGVDYWGRHLFLEDGTPRYYAGRTWPLDAHNYAQAVETWLAVAPWRGDALARAERAAALLVERMLEPDGHVAFQRRRLWTSRVAFVRWTTAPAFRALARLQLARTGREAAS
jgi:glycosyltransferase involved in cell wall biosynthesis